MLSSHQALTADALQQYRLICSSMQKPVTVEVISDNCNLGFESRSRLRMYVCTFCVVLYLQWTDPMCQVSHSFAGYFTTLSIARLYSVE
jgi:hypothetical protein